MPGPNVTQVHEENCFISLSIYVNSTAVPPPSECPTIYEKIIIIITIEKGRVYKLLKQEHAFKVKTYKVRNKKIKVKFDLDVFYLYF